MRNKWFFSAFIIALAFISVSLDATRVPNQEIIIQFSDSQAAQTKTQETIDLVRSELLQIDAKNIKVAISTNGTLKISYYSEVEVSDIKKMFSNELSSTLGDSSQDFRVPGKNHPTDQEPDTYQLDIFKIQESIDLDGFTNAVVESNSEITRSSSINSYAFVNRVWIQNKKTLENVAFSDYRKNAIIIDHSSHKIPEVRAGPIS